MKWYHKYLSVYNVEYTKRSAEIANRIKANIQRLQSELPLVTVSVIAYNEEKHLLSCLWSLSDMKCKYPVEIIGVDNNSVDKTSLIFKDCGIEPYTENRHSCGYARSCGLTNAKGKYHINIDADTIYPPLYIEIMTEALMNANVAGVSSSWSYIPDSNHTRLGLFLYEAFRDIYLYIQSFKRPELSVRGLVFAYNTELAKIIGIRTDIIRGEDGSLALGLKKHGKIKFIRNRKARAITGYGTVSNDGSFIQSFIKRIIARIKNINTIFTSETVYKDEKNNLLNQSKKDENN